MASYMNGHKGKGYYTMCLCILRLTDVSRSFHSYYRVKLTLESEKMEHVEKAQEMIYNQLKGRIQL